jgi:hypothetical protein
VSCGGLFKQFSILPPLSQYIFSLLMFVINNKDLFLTNSYPYDISTTQANNLHLHQANLTLYQKGVHYSGIKIFNSLPIEIKNISNKLICGVLLSGYTYKQSGILLVMQFISALHK